MPRDPLSATRVGNRLSMFMPIRCSSPVAEACYGTNADYVMKAVGAAKETAPLLLGGLLVDHDHGGIGGAVEAGRLGCTRGGTLG